MTTIAVRNGVMASDSQYTHQDLRTLGQKIFRVNESILGISGHIDAALVFVDWFKDREARRPDLANENGFEVIELNASGLYTWTASLRQVPIAHKFYAIGSGAHLAMGAMERGASAKQAVAIACRWDTGSSEPVATMKLA